MVDKRKTDLVKNTTLPVSYTHLDVYKRQSFQEKPYALPRYKGR